ncbi:MAG: FMN-binding protein [Bacteroidota bacterium]
MKTGYIYGFGAIMTVVVALLLAGMKTALNDQIVTNEEVFNKRAILEAVSTPMVEAGGKAAADLDNEEVLSIFDNQVKQSVIDANGDLVEGKVAFEIKMPDEKKKPAAERVYPVYEFTRQDGKKYYIFSVIGNGLWDIIWGNISLESDYNTIAGVFFDHAGETPGLGAEIKDNGGWKKQFIGNEVYKDGEYVGVNVRKGGAKDEVYEVDGLSGATITADGVTDMIYNGFSAYEEYFADQKAAGPTGMLQQ